MLQTFQFAGLGSLDDAGPNERQTTGRAGTGSSGFKTARIGY
jgi:hypothetical protein